MRRRRVLGASLFAGALALAGGCSRAESTTGAPPLPTAMANIDSIVFGSRSGMAIQRSGGFAALVTDAAIDSASGGFLLVTHHPCSGVPCRPALDSASGSIPAADVRGLFELIASERVFDLKSDWGTCANCADQYFYSTTFRVGGRRKVIGSDDGTIPAGVRRVQDRFFQLIARARGQG